MAQRVPRVLTQHTGRTASFRLAELWAPTLVMDGGEGVSLSIDAMLTTRARRLRDL